MRHLFFFLLGLIFLGCSATTLNYTKQNIHLQNDDINYNLAGKTLGTDSINLSQIFIEQKVFRSDLNEVLVYEYARVNTGYKFKYTYTYILSNIFDTKKVTKVQETRGLGFFIIELKNNQKIFLLAKTGSKKSLTLLYGFSKENFNALLLAKPLHKQKTLKKALNKEIKTLWSPKLIIMGTLLKSENFGVMY